MSDSKFVIASVVTLGLGLLWILVFWSMQGFDLIHSWGMNLALYEIISSGDSLFPLGFSTSVPPVILYLLERSSASPSAAFIQDCYSLTTAGTWVLKQSPLLPYFYLPFSFFGGHSLLIGHIFWSLAATWTLILLARDSANTSYGLVVIPTMFFFMSQAHGLLWTPSTEAIATTALSCALLTLKRFPVFAGCLVGVLGLFRPSNLVITGLFGVWGAVSVGQVSPRTRFVAGLVLGVIVLLGSNAVLFGNPLSFSYDHIPTLQNGQVAEFQLHSKGFESQEFTDRLYEFLFSERYGLIMYNPILLLLLIGLVQGKVRAATDTILILLWLSFVLMTLHILSYPYASISILGNRYLAPILLPLVFRSVGVYSRQFSQRSEASGNQY